jgi:uncharacterized protein YhaN
MAASATEEEIGEGIARELSGGYDLQAVVRNEPFHLKSNHGREEEKRLRAATSNLDRQRGEHADLQRKQESLDELEREKALAEEAGLEVQAHRRALVLHDARRERQDRQRALAEFPDDMEQLRGDERERLEGLHGQRGEQQLEAEEALRREADARERNEQSGLGDSEVDETALATQGQQVELLRSFEDKIDRLKDQVRDGTVEYRRAKQDLGAETPKSDVNLSPAAIASVERQLGDKRRVDAQILALEAKISGFSSEDQATTDSEVLREGRRAMLNWLSAPRGQPRLSIVRIAWIVVLILSLSAAVVGAAVMVTPLFWLVALPIVAALIALLRGGSNDDRQQGEAVEAFRRTGLDGPKAWQDVAVSDRLQKLDRQLSQVEQSAREVGRKQEASNQRRVLEQERKKIVAALQPVARDVGFAPDRLDASFDRWLRLVATYDESRKKRDLSMAEYKSRRKKAEKLRSRLVTFLGRFGERIEEESPDAAALGGRLERLAQRLRDRDKALGDMKERAADIERCKREVTRLEGEIGELYEKAGVAPGDKAALEQRIDRRDSWKEAQEDLLKADEAVRIADRELGEWSQLREFIEQDDRDGLERGLARAEEMKASYEVLVRSITEIQTLIEQTQHERKLEELLAARQTAEETLRERLEDALFAGAGQFLINEIEREHVAESRPLVLKQAQKWFGQFTHNQFELEFASNGRQGFSAIDTRAGERRQLEELSTGTRMQLLLAVRLAFAIEAEQGRALLPLFLDEVLTTADPERYKSIVESIQLFATEQGRQVFYLTAQPQDAEPWASNGGPAPHRIDMGDVRGQEYGLTDASVLTLSSLPTIPAPNGQRPEEYAVELRVPLIDPWAPSDAIHVFHLLRDDLGLLHRLLEERTDRLGTLKALLKSDAVIVLLGEQEIRQLRARVAIAEAFGEAWHTGRGRPVDREAIENSPVTDRYYDELDLLAEELKGDARALVAAIEGKRIKGFQSKKREEFEEWLRKHRYLVDRSPLSEVEIDLRVLATVTPFVDDGTMDAGTVRQRVRELSSGLIG